MPPKRIGLGVYRQQPFTEWHEDHWRIWVIYNNAVTAGTYFRLELDGRCFRVIENENMIEDILHVAG